MAVCLYVLALQWLTILIRVYPTSHAVIHSDSPPP